MANLAFPNFEILKHGNVYSGSAMDFNYKLRPKDGKIFVTINWGYDPGTARQEEFELLQEGYEAAKAWLEEQADK